MGLTTGNASRSQGLSNEGEHGLDTCKPVWNLSSNTTLFAPLQIQVWGQFDNYLLTSVILIAVAIILLMLYISCYAWVFRGNLDLPKPTKAFSIKGRSGSFKPARQDDVILDPDTLFPLDMENTSNIILLN